jgi:hypothetical protein
MADENKPAFYPRVGRNIAKNFRSAQPVPFIEDPRAMDLPQYGDVDLSVPSKENLEMSRRMAERDAQLRRQREADRSPLEKLAGGLQAGRFMGSAMTQGINSIPTRLAYGDEAADKFMQERLYKPEQPLAYEYAGDIGDFLEKLETEYKIPPLLPEAVALQYLTGPATQQAMRVAGKGAEQAGRALERGMEPVVKGALERGGLPREMVMAMGANTQSNVVKPYGGNWLGGEDQLAIPERDLRRLKDSRGIQPDALKQLQADLAEISALPNAAKKHDFVIRQMQDEIDRARIPNAINNWIDSNLKNYVKKEMGTRDDPVRKLAEEGIIHMPLRDDLDRMEYLQDIRKAEGYPAEGMGKSELAKQWENLSDDAIRVSKAGNIQEQANTGAKLEKARAELDAHKKQIDDDFITLLQGKGGLEIKDREVFDRMPNFQKAEILGDTKYKELQGKINDLLGQEHGFEKRAGETNPFVAKLDPETRLYSGSIYDLGFDHIIDVLKEDLGTGRIRPEQLNKVSMEQAVRRTYEYDQELAKKMNDARMTSRAELPVYKEYPEGLKWVQLNRPGDFAAESDAMGHSVRGYEPPESHPDWTKSSGEEGHSSYGLGGWEAIKRGDAKVYSLVDSKGEPHVTIEVGKAPQSARGFYDLPSDIQDEIRDTSMNAVRSTDDPRLWDRNENLSDYGYQKLEQIKDEMARDWLKNNTQDKPDRIVQIKGKQNAKPKADYLPFVQDFVKGGNWSDIGDFRNTGLIREGGRIMTPAEHADYLLKELGADTYNELGLGATPPPAGMKRGGKVSISNNPDTMMLEVNNQMMAKGGLTKLLRAAPKSKAEIDAIARRMAPQMLGEFVRGRTGSQSVAEKTQKQFAKEKEMMHDIRPTGAERALPREVDIEELKDQVMVGIAGDPTISGKTIYSVNGIPLDSPSPQHGGPLYGLGRDDAFWASGLGAANRVQNVAREASEQYDLPVLGNYVMMGPDSINYAQHYADANLAAINPAKMSRGQIEDFNNLIRRGSNKSGPRPSFPGIENPSEAYLHFSVDPELRKHFNALMQMPTVTEKYNLPSGIDVRHAVTEPDLRDLEIGVTGKSIGRLRPEIEDLGYSEHPTYSHDIPGEFMGSSKYPTPYELSFPDTLKSVRENPKQAPQEFGSFKYVGPRQVIDQQLIDEIKQYQEMIKKYTGKKKGGAVKKAAGGAISGDDLILEERPL